MAALQKGEVNGELWEWHTASGWQKVPGSEASGANGLEMSSDAKTLYVAAWGSQSFFRLSRGGAKPEKQEVPLGFRVDNIRWSRDGSILATGQGAEFHDAGREDRSEDTQGFERGQQPAGRSVQRGDSCR
jgi:sugar lactone lactonase YvrE